MTQEARKRRIFWLGYHKVLKYTELKRLRDLGFEVFNPRYISEVYDQSADHRADLDQPSTLPLEVFHTLMQFNFFHVRGSYPPQIKALLNAHFDVAIVTINADWLKTFLDAYDGRVIYRIYGQPYSLSDHMASIGLPKVIFSRPDFTIVPFSSESIEYEHAWFKRLCVDHVPYQIPDDVFGLSGQWKQANHRLEIAVNIPNIENPSYAHAYRQFSSKFPHRFFRIYGPQRSVPLDRRIVGGLDRRAFLLSLRESAGFFYNYSDHVCYLPPIEMMEIGGPVIYVRGSLLSKFFDQSPGLASDELEAEKKLRWLLEGDHKFINEVVAAQEPVRQRYDRAHVLPLFDAAFVKLLGEHHALPAKLQDAKHIAEQASQGSPRQDVILFLLHIPGLIGRKNGQTFAIEGIPRVVEKLIEVTVEQLGSNVVVSCMSSDQHTYYDFFEQHIAAEKLSLLVIDQDEVAEQTEINRLKFVEDVNQQEHIRAVFVPHYYAFPESMLLKQPLILYLPDYFPYLMPNHAFDVSKEKDEENRSIGIEVAAKAKAILTASAFTKSYLPDAGFVQTAELDKVVVTSLPQLGRKAPEKVGGDAMAQLEADLKGNAFIFYPTANRPNKQLSFLIRVFSCALIHRPDLRLVLTCSLDSVPGVVDTVNRFEIADRITLKQQASDEEMAWLFTHSSALCLTSTAEGNFPPQLREALFFRTPIVATRLPVITELLKEREEELLLCRPLDLVDFVDKLQLALDDRQSIVCRQEGIRDLLSNRDNSPEFFEGFKRALALATPYFTREK